MTFSVGDKVVHPSHGAGRITGLESKDLVNGPKRYYVIEIPTSGLTVFVPRRTIDQIGVRPAMKKATLAEVLDILRGVPRRLPEDYRERQELVWEQLKTGIPVQIACAVRDLIGHERRAHLTRKDSELLARGTDLLATEIALVSDLEVADARQSIARALEATQLAA